MFLVLVVVFLARFWYISVPVIVFLAYTIVRRRNRRLEAQAAARREREAARARRASSSRGR